MAGNAGLKLTVWTDDKSSGPLKAIGNEAKRMGEGFSKSAAALRLVDSAAGQMGGKIADAAGKITGLASIAAAGGPFGLALAAVAGGLALWTKGLDLLYGNTEKTKSSIDELNEHIDDQDRKLKPLMGTYRELQKLMEKAEGAQKSFDESFREGFDARAAINAKINAMEEKAADRREKRAAARKKRMAEEKKALEARASLMMRLEERIASGLNEIDEANAERRIKLTNDVAAAQEKADEERVDRAQAVGDAVGDVATGLTAVMLANTKEEKNAAISAALDQLQAHAVEGAAAAASSAASSLPFPASVIVPPIAGAAVYAAITAIRSKIGFQRGGYTGDGPPGEVAGVVHRGEYVVPAPIVQQVRRGMGGGGTTVINNFNSVMPPNNLETRRAVREIEKHAKKMRSRGADA